MSLLLLFKISGETRARSRERERGKERHFCNHETIVSSDQSAKRKKNLYQQRKREREKKHRKRDVSSTGFLEETKLFAEREHEIYIDVYVS